MSRSKFIALVLLLGAAFARVQAAPPPPAQAEIAPLPSAPAWVSGYRVRFPLRPVGEFLSDKLLTESIVARLPTAGWVRPDGSDICVQAVDGTIIPVAILSHHPGGDTLIQFKRHGSDPLYWAYAGNPQAAPANGPIIPEGLYVEFRDWAGDSLASWADVVAGLKKSTVVTANAFVDMIAQNVNPGRPDNNHNFTASYRGFLKVAEADTYKFYVGAEDAAFLFIDGNRVFEQKGSHHFTVRFPSTDWVEVELTAGVHALELHHVCGADALVPTCSLYFRNDGAKKKAASNFVSGEWFAKATIAEALQIEGPEGAPAATFAWGVDDTLSTPGINLHLARFEAQGTLQNPSQVEWNFGDGTRATGASPLHVFFKSGEYQVTMKAGLEQPAITQRVYMWTAPSPTSPFSLAKAVELLTSSNWHEWDTQRVNSLFDFLTVCEQPNRWPLVEKIGRHLLAQPDLDVKRRLALQTTLMDALAEQGRGAEALALMPEAMKTAGRLPSLQVMAQLKAADIQWESLKNYQEASQLYEKIITQYRGFDIPAVREAAIHWGDLFTQAGDLAQAEERYRLAKTLGGERFASTSQTDAIQRGAQLRIAEQKLRGGDVRGTRLLLEKMEVDFPEQKLEGTYNFLRAETDRFAGRYDEATQHYEVLLKLRQWAGFRDRAIHGIADCYYRKEEYGKALEWFDKLRESFPEYFELQKLEATCALIKARLERQASGAKEGAKRTTFQGFHTAFEPADNYDGLTLTQRLKLEADLGIDGSTVAAVTSGGLNALVKDLRDLPTVNEYWLEFWYREQAQSRDVVSWSSAILAVPPGADKTMKTFTDQLTIGLGRTYGGWRKAAARFKLPLVQDIPLRISFANAFGLLRIDGLTILPITDRQADSLRSFIEVPEIE